MTERDVQLNPNNVKEASIIATRWAATIEPDHILEDLMKPHYWAHSAMYFTPGDIVEVRTEDGSHYGRFYVTDCSRTHASMFKLEWHKLDGATAEHVEDYVYAWKGPVKKHCILRVADQTLVQEQLPTKKDALQWILNQQKEAA